MPKSPEEMRDAMLRNMPAKTGKSLDEWLPIARSAGIDRQRALTNWLKDEHGLTYGYANTIAWFALNAGAAPTGDALVEAQYTGAKAGLRPIYDRLIAALSEFGPGVEIAPKKTYVSLRHKTQFALVQPSTRTRVDVGIKLKGVAAGARLEDAGSWNGMVTHRVRVTAPGDVDDELVGWLREAFERAG